MPDDKTILPKSSALKKVRVSSTGYSSEKVGDTLSEQGQDYYNRSVKDVRSLSKKEAIRALVHMNGLLSSAVGSFVNTAMSGYSVKTYDSVSHQFSQSGTATAKAIMAGFDTLQDYSQGYADKPTISSLVQTLVQEVVLTGGCGGELVLDKFRLPDRVVPLNVNKLTWKVKKDKRKYPVQATSGEDLPLDLPTVWVESLHQDVAQFSPSSMLESSLADVWRFLDFVEDMGLVLKRAGHSRLTATISLEQTTKSAPPDVQNDPKKLKKYLEDTQASAQALLSSLEPEEAIVAFDNVTFDLLSAKGESAGYTDLLESLSGLVASSLKSMPSVLGLRIGKGSQSMSNTETMMYLKSVETVRQPVESLMSRVLTLASRLQGEDVYAKFEFHPIDLRPTNEIEAHKAIKQSQILDKLSLGFLTDEEAALELGTNFRDSSLPPLSGTMFREGSTTEVDPSKATPNNGAQEKALTSDSPDKTTGRPKNA